MVDVPDSLRTVFTATVDEHDGSYTVEVPAEEVANDVLIPGETYRVAILDGGGSASTADAEASRDRPDGRNGHGRDARSRSDGPTGTTSGSAADEHRTTPPVDEGEVREVAIESIGDQGDGIAKVDRGYVVIVPNARPGDRPTVEIERVRPNVAFASVVEAETDRI